MYRVTKSEVLRAFVLMGLFFGLNRALGEEGDIKAPETAEVSDNRKELFVITPKDDKGIYSIDVCDNGVEVVLTTIPDERNILTGVLSKRYITLEVIIGWGNGYGSGSTGQFEEFLCTREKRIHDMSDGKQRLSLRIGKEYTYLRSSIRRNHFDSDVAQFFKFFNIKENGSSDADVDSILNNIMNDEEVSLEDLNIFFKESFLRSKTTFFVSGINIKEEEAERIRQEAAKIRSSPERTVPATELNSRRSYFINSIKSLDNWNDNPSSRRHSIKMVLLPYESTFFQRNSAEVIAKIVKDEVEDKLMEYIETAYPNADYEISFGDFTYSNGLASTEFRFCMSQSENGDPFNEEVHEKILGALFSCLREVRISVQDYRKFIESIKEEVGGLGSLMSFFVAMLVRPEIPTLWLSAEEYIDCFHKFEDLNSDGISKILQRLSNIENWDIAVLGGYSHKLSNEAVSRIKTKVSQVLENPSTNREVTNQ